jgi:DNA-binding transcriptional regulator YdaS (Cro superfamily)
MASRKRRRKPAWRWRNPTDFTPGMRLAIEAFGGNMSDLARAVGIRPQAIAQWEDVPVRRIIDVERVTRVPREQLRPDLYRHQRRRSAAK